MPPTLLCPSCQRAVMFDDRSLESCPFCFAQLPAELRQAALVDLAAERSHRPVGLTIGMVLSGIFGVVNLLFIVLAPLDLVSYSVDGEAVSGSEFLSAAGVNYAAITLLLLVIAFGLWTHRSWTRPLMLFYWIMFAVVSTLPDRHSLGVVGITIRLLAYALALGLAATYLYEKKSVKQYYAGLEGKEQ